ncbi:hypothetical protein CKO42_09120 [Lamprobacter modestohalophilus]|uniref:HTH cro/C1-type domain-containing protein n=1 Tax=Lamprobacter modestohalophilus TaxID=1064514 RepID=A0A9X0W871_9GAMM|nr:helix-turn-helix transcriptional regulator [Lamprobacter modestohalophilus]MBK1618596.1 hypothetical protein [Lamprobacter modestohalophilus]
MYETTRLAIALRMARAVAQMTQVELASALDVSKTIIARNERADMAMRADTLVRLIAVMRSRQIEIDLFSTLDTVRLEAAGPHLDSAAMRAARAALNISQQAFADELGLSKSVVTHGERNDSIMRSDTLMILIETMQARGIDLDWSPVNETLSVIVQAKAVLAIEEEERRELIPLSAVSGVKEGQASTGTMTEATETEHALLSKLLSTPSEASPRADQSEQGSEDEPS